MSANRLPNTDNLNQSLMNPEQRIDMETLIENPHEAIKKINLCIALLNTPLSNKNTKQMKRCSIYYAIIGGLWSAVGVSINDLVRRVNQFNAGVAQYNAAFFSDFGIIKPCGEVYPLNFGSDDFFHTFLTQSDNTCTFQIDFLNTLGGSTCADAVQVMCDARGIDAYTGLIIALGIVIPGVIATGLLLTDLFGAACYQIRDILTLDDMPQDKASTITTYLDKYDISYDDHTDLAILKKRCQRKLATIQNQIDKIQAVNDVTSNLLTNELSLIIARYLDPSWNSGKLPNLFSAQNSNRNILTNFKIILEKEIRDNPSLRVCLTQLSDELQMMNNNQALSIKDYLAIITYVIQTKEKINEIQKLPVPLIAPELERCMKVLDGMIEASKEKSLTLKEAAVSSPAPRIG